MDEQSEHVETSAESEFKKPVLVGRVGKLPKKAKTEPEKVPPSEPKPETPSKPESSAKSNLPPAVLLKEISTPIPYKEPKWSGLCPDGSDYALEVIKSGMIVDNVPLTQQPYYVFGRLANCDVVMAHPTISRHHAVLQYKAFAEADEPPSGWYLYDLGSTHGTHLNRDRLKPNHYTRVRVGHQIKFGSSTRTYIVLGPDFDCEGESELTVTEIKQRAQTMKQERERMIQEAVEQREKDREAEERRKEEQGIDWGMGEDAEEEPDLSDNPYAATNNEELFLQDPKKTLRGYYEREGHELTYHCDERGAGQFLCRVELPIEDARGQPVIAEVLHKGKKKEAVVACALAACRLLDRAGVLRQASHESRRRKQRDWGADDYYDSDDDTFLDRTGAVERKRDQRRDKYGDAKEEPLTYDTLLEQIKDLEEKIAAEQKTLERLRAAKNQPQDMDDYMQAIPGTTMAHKAEISKTKMAISKLQSELSSRRRLAQLARPAAPPILTRTTPGLKTANSVVYGKRIRLKDDKKQLPKPAPLKQQETEFVEEMDSDEETPNTDTDKTDLDKNTDKKNSDVDKNTDNIDKNNKSVDTCDTTTDNIDNATETDKAEMKEEKRVFGPMRPPENYVAPENYFEQESDRDMPEMTDDDV
ncbi:kanadaptin [Cydia splendana]|uniref:kanadaptin n=1 Tax=Cydia splendana TaxID=1100963 RepID=UPI00214594B8